MKSFFSVTNKAEAPSAEILIFDEIGLWGITAKDFAEALSSIPPDREIVCGINSPGGDVFQGWAFYNLLAARRDKITMRIDGVAASIAAVIAMAGKRIIMPPASLLMIHNASVGNYGEADDLRQAAAVLDKINTQSIAIFAQRTGKTDDEIRALMPPGKDFWMTPAEAKELGFCDDISGGSVATAVAKIDFHRFKNGPKPVGDAKQNPEGKTSKPNQSMKILLAALAAATFIPSADCSEEDAVKAFNANHKKASDETVNLRKQVEDAEKATQTAKTSAETAIKNAAEAFVASAVESGKIKDDAKLRERWMNAFKSDPEGTRELVAAMETSKQRGAAPIPEPGKDGKKEPEITGRARMAAAFKAQFEKAK